ncbi:hypothetical protein FO519_002034 [Halicephalobus sp. NKZ332]|nr:hypothetical protein FO519_002034 [Halicephalobus sp. NKZ332]
MITGPNPEFMKIALDEALVGVLANEGGPFGAVVVKEGMVVGRGHNMVTGTNDVTAHAEVTAIRDACSNLKSYDLSGCQLYTSCYPCPMCMGAALWARVNAVYYAASAADAAAANFDDSIFHDFVKNPISEPGRVFEKVDIVDHLKPFQTWQAKADKIPY